jgi:pyruvate/2-oxoglutarate dehydrogenase complex dihydrolipoamide acyltransferase (E2) component
MAQRYILEADWGIAVRKINPNSQFTGTLENITWQEGTTPISREDIQAKIDEMNAELDNKATDQASGNQKLLDLGLTQAEATALTGYTPPVAE